MGRRTCLEGFWLGLEMVLTEVGCFFSLIAEVNIAMGFILVCLVGWTGRTIIICVVMTCKGVLSHFSFFVRRLLIKLKNMAFEAIESIK